ncbi:MAG: glutamine amidotransferase subunit PdxT [Microbacterium sp. SCN 70-27]|uniref:pyridoxal 5'-phosphate synthase glutaminase subunit PdxT n=1 Tax=unclassified Microbacterium TaxID=2609290 RepID=UPI00086A9F27|nr:MULTISPECIES: pyridoxal 5'-phosphate synthase glutaminase subunit PdxT [unclassified Microbacterium]MBN9223262.1 pyridoxal 5'-phosphate synthase glutaminase subunit PdxT [Microbacterium sp.]ODT26505.1 MAG: glutamine amidotransferase subunit PdxT [Microbacterium sp. SCN 70-27]
MTARVGVLALQGDVREHVRVLSGLGAEVTLVRRPDELAAVGGLVLPGGESSVIDKLSRAFGMQQPIRAAIAAGMPVYGTCAGLILLAGRIENPIDGQESFGGLDIAVRRNAFGGQVESFETDLDVAGFDAPAHAAFIRAPLVTATGAQVETLAALPPELGGGIVAVRQGNLLGTAFHPEVSGDTRFHELFLGSVRAA